MLSGPRGPHHPKVHSSNVPRCARPACDRLELLRGHLSHQGAAPDAGGKMLRRRTGRAQTPGVRRRQKHQHRLSRLVVVAVRIAPGVCKRRPAISGREELYVATPPAPTPAVSPNCLLGRAFRRSLPDWSPGTRRMRRGLGPEGQPQTILRSASVLTGSPPSLPPMCPPPFPPQRHERDHLHSAVRGYGLQVASARHGVRFRLTPCA